MASVSDHLSMLKAIKGLRHIFLFAGSELIYSNVSPPPKGLIAPLLEVLPLLHERYLQEMEQLEAMEIHLASFKVMIYPKEQLTLVLFCEAQVDAVALQKTADGFIHNLLQHRELQRRIKGIKDTKAAAIQDGS
jgi:hypothetical protein